MLIKYIIVDRDIPTESFFVTGLAVIWEGKVGDFHGFLIHKRIY